MTLLAVLPWLWWGTALVAVVQTLRRVPGGAVLAAVAALLASLHQFGWNKPIYQFGRDLLQANGFYEQRLVFKIGLGVVFFPLAAWLVWRGLKWSARVPFGQRLALVAMATDLLYIAIRTLSIDGWLPLWIGEEPGKSQFGTALAGAALLLVVLASRRPVAEPPAKGGQQFLKEGEHAFIGRR